ADALVELAAALGSANEAGLGARFKAETIFYIGRAHYIAGDLKKARANLNAAIKRNPRAADAYYYLGQIEFEQEKFDAAFAAYKKAVEVDPSGNPRAWFYLGDVSSVLGKDADAKKALKTYAEKFPNGANIQRVQEMLGKLK
ncbi:MAG: tetratricopeptide repeat protein, partial [Deltaproteobacteria bacterium]|nr:tetratricopeptide repeat protein [Deltaproteobacteria bacterium]